MQASSVIKITKVIMSNQQFPLPLHQLALADNSEVGK